MLPNGVDLLFSVIFDMDGTLLDTQKVCIPAWEFAGQNQGIIGAGNEIKNVCGMNKIGWSAYLRKRFPDLDVDKFNTEMRQYINENLVVKYKSGGKELLEFLKQNGIKIGLASGSSLKSVMHHLNEVGATDYFSAIVGGDEISNGKPAPDIFLLTAERLGVEPESCIVFEDSPNGIKAGINAGMRCIGIPDIAEFSSETKELLFAEFESLDKAIEILSKEI